MTSLPRLLTQALATYRITRLITEDTITAPLRDAIFARFGDPSTSKEISLSYAVTCPHCASIYAAAAVAALTTLSLRAPAPIRLLATFLTTTLALSGTISLLNDYGPDQNQNPAPPPAPTTWNSIANDPPDTYLPRP